MDLKLIKALLSASEYRRFGFGSKEFELNSTTRVFKLLLLLFPFNFKCFNFVQSQWNAAIRGTLCSVFHA